MPVSNGVDNFNFVLNSRAYMKASTDLMTTTVVAVKGNDDDVRSIRDSDEPQTR